MLKLYILISSLNLVLLHALTCEEELLLSLRVIDITHLPSLKDNKIRPYGGGDEDWL